MRLIANDVYKVFESTNYAKKTNYLFAKAIGIFRKKTVKLKVVYTKAKLHSYYFMCYYKFVFRIVNK